MRRRPGARRFAPCHRSTDEEALHAAIHGAANLPARARVPVADGGGEICRTVVERNADEGVTWVHSYVSADRRTSFCVYDAPTPEAIRKTAARNDLPVDQITQVQVLDPYFYTGEGA
jgi:hypothetical protein